MEIPDEFLDGVVFVPKIGREQRANWLIIYFPEANGHSRSPNSIEARLKSFRYTECFVFQLERDEDRVRACIALTLSDGYRDPRFKLKKVFPDSNFYYVENIEIVRRYCLRTNERLSKPRFCGFSDEEITCYLNKYALITKKYQTPKEIEAFRRSKEVGIISDYDVEWLQNVLRNKKATRKMKIFNRDHVKQELTSAEKIKEEDGDRKILLKETIPSLEEDVSYFEKTLSVVETEIHELLTDPYSPTGSPVPSPEKAYHHKPKPKLIKMANWLVIKYTEREKRREDKEKHPYRIERPPLENLERNKRDWKTIELEQEEQAAEKMRELEEEKQAIEAVQKLTEQEQIASIIHEQVSEESKARKQESGTGTQIAAEKIKPPISRLKRRVHIRTYDSSD